MTHACHTAESVTCPRCAQPTHDGLTKLHEDLRVCTHCARSYRDWLAREPKPSEQLLTRAAVALDLLMRRLAAQSPADLEWTETHAAAVHHELRGYLP